MGVTTPPARQYFRAARRPPAQARVDARAAAGPWRGLWIGYLIFTVTLSAVFFVQPDYHLVLWAPLGLSSVAATIFAVVRYKPRHRAAWILLAGAELSFIAGDTVYNVLTQLMGYDNPFPSTADVFYLLMYVLLAGGIYQFIRGRSSPRDRASLIDALIITTGVGLLAWVYLVAPYFQVPGLTTLQRFASIAYPLGDVLVIAMLIRLVGDGGLRVRSMQFLVIGAGGLMVADVLYGASQLNEMWHVGGPADGGWVMFYVAWGCAALHPSMVRLGQTPPRHGALRVGRWRLAGLASAGLIAPGIVFAESLTGSRADARTVASFSAVIFLLVVARLWSMLGVHQQSVRRESALRSSSEALVSAQGLPAIYQAALAAVTSLTGTSGVTHAGIFEAGDVGLTCAAGFGPQPDASRRDALWQVAAAGGDLSAPGTLSISALRYNHEDRGMLVVGTTAPLTLDQHAALSTLAAQVVLAVESARLAEDLRALRNEELFRGVLQNTSDIVIIVNARGEITFGTPSLGRTLGRAVEDVVGHELAEILQADDAVDAIAMFAGFAANPTQSQAMADWHLARDDGTLVAFEVLSTNLLEDPRVAGIVLTMRDVSERRALEVQLKHQAFHDALTGLPNRALFSDRADHALARTSRLGSVVAMLMLDLDDFKIVNDTRGHAAGDELLVHVATRLRSIVRAGATVSRFGGDEFAVLVEDLTDVSQAEAFAERALHAFATPFTVLGEDLWVGASVGLVVTGGPHDPLDMTEMMRCADLALYAAKDLGKGQIMLYHRGLSTAMMDRLTRRSDLEQALGAEQFVVHYQPIVLIRAGEIVGCEALVRWSHPTRGLLPPKEFVELAEETGLIVELGGWVLDQACAQLRTWSDAGHAGLRLSVNVSARQLHEEGFVDVVRTALERHRIDAGQLTLELTESIFALDAPVVSDRLLALRELGVKIAMDDFGTGYSSLSYLQKLHIDVLKIDKSFVDGLGEAGSDGSALVDVIISLAHSLRLEVVAEGIEQSVQRDELWSMGCRVGQGYLYARPVAAEKMSELLASASPLGPKPATGPPGVERPRRAALQVATQQAATPQGPSRDVTP
ncbi:EAL domain-containing protein [Pengzhenrongella sp.]|jgi:diguanylate cyclase (GGDEF)-like protein/PAS domain S-box-containing protein|uniref:EAL domain-containing protein n=1 Tax=Pengzhenrongella sp. TaxID=2888820 RepID=UPI002F93ED56